MCRQICLLRPNKLRMQQVYRLSTRRMLCDYGVIPARTIVKEAPLAFTQCSWIRFSLSFVRRFEVPSLGLSQCF